MKIHHRLTAALLAAAVLFPLLTACQSTGVGKLLINEVMSRNTSFLTDASGATPDWLELYNPGDTDVSLKGWFLSDDQLDPDKYAFPDVTVKAGGYRVVFCDGQNYYDPETDELHASFNLSSAGETIYLLSRNGRLDSVEVGEGLSDVSYGRVEEGTNAEQYRWFAAPTPGEKNSGTYAETAKDVQKTVTAALQITAYSHANAATLPAPDGGYYGYVDVTNITAAPVSLSGYCLSDSEGNREKWHLPASRSLTPGETLRVWCSGEDTVKEDGTVHTNFKFNNRDTVLSLSLAGTVVQSLALTEEAEGLCRIVDADDPDLWYYCRIAGTTLSETADGAATPAEIGLVISEASSVKGNGATEDHDWVELYNATDTDIDLSGWSLSDDPDDRTLYTFEDVTIRAGAYKLVYCVGSDPTADKKGSLYAGFKLDAAGETVYLTDPKGITTDLFTVGKLRKGVSSGREGNKATTQRVFFDKPTPGEENASVIYTGYVRKPVLSETDGFVTVGTTVTVTSQEGGVTLRYTTDGSEPTASSPAFDALTVNKTTVLRVRAFADGKLPSDTATATYLLGEGHDMPVVCLTADPDDLFSTESGILVKGDHYSSSFPYSGANFWQDWEREANFAYFVEGEKVIDNNVGIKVFGQYSRAYDQKSLAVYFRGDYGADSVSYPFFENSDHTTLCSLVLRAGGQDQGMTRIRDAFCSQVMKGSSSLVFQDWAPVAVYLNGQYWGYFDLREKINAEWLSMYAGIRDENSVDLIKGNRTAKAGTNEAYLELLDYVKSHDLSKDEYYDYVAGKVDIDNYIDYLITEIFFCNGDTGNVKFYCEKSDTGKWRWIMFDFDMTLRNEALWNRYDMFENLFNPSGHGAGNSFSSTLQCGLLKNDEFEEKFIQRFAELLNSNFRPEYMRPILDDMIAQIDSEMPRHCDRWGKPETYEDWQEEVDNLYRIVDGRREHVKKQLIEYFDLSDSEVARLFPED